MPKVNDVVSAYRRLRDSKKALETEQAEALKPIKEKMEKLENWLHAHLNEVGADSIATPDGTVYKTTTASVRIEDWSATIQYIIENNLWHMLEKRLAKSQVEAYVEEEQHNLIGTSITYQTSVNVRK